MTQKRLCRAGLLAGIFGTLAVAQAPVPSTYQDLYNLLQGQISAFDAQVNSQWNGQRTAPVAWGGGLATANANRGRQLATASALTGTLLELDRLQSLGLKSVTVAVGFPMLYQPFYDYNGDPGDYQVILDYYRRVAAAVHSKGMKLVVESQYLFPGIFSQGSGFDLSGYYQTLSSNQLLAGRVQNITTILQNMQPEYLNLGSEPDTAAEILGQAVPGPAVYASDTAALLSQLRPSAGSTKIGAGIGTWQRNGASYVQSLCSIPIDFVDLHIYPVNFSLLTSTTGLTDAAKACGKEVGIAEAWVNKQRDSELSNISVASNANIFARDPFSFWAPVDTAFLNALVKFAYWKNLAYISPFWTKYFWAYLDYSSVENLPPDQVTAQSSQASAAALASGGVTSTGTAYSTAIGSAGGLPQVATVSAASGVVGNLAPDSLISIYGSNLATGSSQASSLPLPVNLSGTSASVRDSGGNEHPIGLIFVSPGQINAYLPAGLSLGPAVITVSVNNTPMAQSNINVTAVAPGFFTANQTGKGVPIAAVVTLHSDGSQTTALAFQGSTVGQFTPAPINLGGPGDESVLVLYGTGIRGRTSLFSVSAAIGSVNAPVTYAGASDPGHFVGFDQVNMVLPKSLAGSGTVNLTVTVDGVPSNTLTLAFP